MTTDLVGKIVGIHKALDRAQVPHAFGGALALAWCTERARATIDIDLNLFVPPEDVGSVLRSLPRGVQWSHHDVELIERDGQARLWWEGTPVDVFFNTTDFHEAAALRAREEPFGGEVLPFLACRDLAVFKAFFNRTKDWADLEAMAEAGALDVEAVLGVLAHYLGATDDRVARVRSLVVP